MKISIFKKKFEIFESYYDKIFGIKRGLDFLKNLKQHQKDISLSDKNSFVFYYDFVDNKILKLDFSSLNKKVMFLYINYYINSIKLNYNQLYWIFYNTMVKTLERKKLKFKKHDKIEKLFSEHDILNKFCQGLRKGETINCYKFYLNDIFYNYDMQYFENTNSQEFYLFMSDFILDLCEKNIFTYDKESNSIEFDSYYIKELKDLMYLSFDLMLLGTDNIHDSYDFSDDNVEKNLNELYPVYKEADEITKNYWDDFFFSYVIVSTVERICYNNKMNNILLERIAHGLNQK